MQIALSCVFGVVLYYGIVIPQRQRLQQRLQRKLQFNTDIQKNQTITTTTTTTSYGLLLGFGILLPLALWLPFGIINFWDIRSKTMRLSWVSLPMTIALTCLEAMYGFTTPYATQSLRNYLLSMAFICRPRIIRPVHTSTIQKTATTKSIKQDHHQQLQQEQHPKATAGHVVQSVLRYFWWFTVTNVAFIVLQPYDYAPFCAQRRPNEIFVSWEMGQWYNTFVQACTYFGSLSNSLSLAPAGWCRRFNPFWLNPWIFVACFLF
jgi:hypothetical protein